MAINKKCFETDLHYYYKSPKLKNKVVSLRKIEADGVALLYKNSQGVG